MIPELFIKQKIEFTFVFFSSPNTLVGIMGSHSLFVNIQYDIQIMVLHIKL